jgi:leucyl-tRNA---protein transferase
MSLPDKKRALRGRRSRTIESPVFGSVPLDFLLEGEPHPCPYLPGRSAREEAFHARDFPPELYHDFMDHGFRRAGAFFYRPVCRECNECRAIRVPIDRFRHKKSFRRVMRKNRDIAVRIGSPRITHEKHRIYKSYQQHQHRTVDDGSSMDLRSFLYETAVETLEFEYRLQDRLIGVGIVDACSRSLSSVYAFYDPEFSSRSLGTFSALREISYCLEKGIPYYYLGFLVKDCPSMNYKQRFKIHEILSSDGIWMPVGTESE